MRPEYRCLLPSNLITVAEGVFGGFRGGEVPKGAPSLAVCIVNTMTGKVRPRLEQGF